MSMKNWSTTAASNATVDSINFAEGQAPSTVNDSARAMMADVRYELATQDTIASATTTDLGSKDAGSLTVSGTTTITGFGTVSAGIRKLLTFSGSLTLTHNGTSLILPGAANITTAAGDSCVAESLGAGNWKVHSYQRAAGTPVASVPISTGVSGLGTGVATALAFNVGSAGAPVVNGGALGTPSSGSLANCTGYTGTSALVTTGALNSGSITSGFGSIDVGADSISGGAISGTSVSSSGPVNVGSDGVSTGAFTNVISLAAPASSGSTRGDFARILDYVGSRLLDVGISSSNAWLQSRDQNDYSVNYTLALNPNGGKVTVGSGALEVSGTVTPSADNTYSCGTGALRWSVVYAATGAINTSDAREKTAVSAMSPAEIEASKQLAREIGIYKWLSAVAEKGDAARKHVGFTVQRAMEIMQANGLDPMAYGFICYDRWDDEFVEHPATDDAPAWTEQTQHAGDRYAFRYDELNLFIARGFEARLAALEA